MCFFFPQCTAGEDVLNCTVTGLSGGQQSTVSARVQLLPRGGLVQSCCLVEMDNARGKALPGRGMVIWFFAVRLSLFSIGYSMEEMLLQARVFPNCLFCDSLSSVLALLLDKVWSWSQCSSVYTELHGAKCPWPEHCVTLNQWTVRMDWMNGYVKVRQHFL